MKSLIAGTARRLLQSLVLATSLIGCLEAESVEETDAAEAAVKTKQPAGGCDSVASPPRSCRERPSDAQSQPWVDWENSKLRLNLSFDSTFTVVKEIVLPSRERGQTSDDGFRGKLRAPIALDRKTHHDLLTCSIRAPEQTPGESNVIAVGARYELDATPDTELLWPGSSEDPDIEVTATFTINAASRELHEKAPETITLSCTWAATFLGMSAPWTDTYFEL